MKILIIEDETVVANRLIRMVDRILGTREHSIRHLEDLFEGLAYIREHTIDLLFLDLNLNGADGFRMLMEATSGSFHTIVVSAHAEQAIRAFEYGVVDFVSKPYTEERMRMALDRVLDRNSSGSAHLKYLAVRKGHEIRAVPIAEILYIRGADDYSEIYCKDGTRHLHDKTLRDLCVLLPADFQRIHRSYVIHLPFVKGYETHSGNKFNLILSNEERIPVSRGKIAVLRSFVKNNNPGSI